MTTAAPLAAVTPSPEEFKCDPSKALDLDFTKSSTTGNNNLGGQGPDLSAPKALTLKSIAKTKAGASVDLVVTAKGNYTPAEGVQNGIKYGRGQINLQSGSFVELVFQFKDSATKAAVTLPEFYFTILDIDQSDARHRERFYVEGFSHLLKEDVNDFETELLPDGRTLIKSQQTGDSWDDPTDPSALTVITNPGDPDSTADQRKRAAMLVFRDTSEFTITFEVTQKTGTNTADRNFMFAGKSSLIDLCPTA